MIGTPRACATAIAARQFADVVAADEQRLEPLEPLAVVEDVERDAAGLADLEVAAPTT